MDFGSNYYHYFSYNQTTFSGEYNKHGMRIGEWEIYFLDSFSN